MNKLLDKVMLIVECDSIIGAATAKSASKEGAIVVCTSKHFDQITTIVSKIIQTGGIASAFQHDVRSLESWQIVIADTINKYGKIDVLINNSGISSPKMMLDLLPEDWKKIQETDINSFTYGLKEVIPVMMKNDGGSIVNVSSLESLVNLPDSSPYAAAQDVIRSISLAVAFKYAKHTIRVNSICPGIIDTPMIETTFPNSKPNYKKSIQFPYFGKPENIVNGIIYLACDESSFVTGAKLIIDGDRISK